MRALRLVAAMVQRATPLWTPALGSASAFTAAAAGKAATVQPVALQGSLDRQQRGGEEHLALPSRQQGRWLLQRLLRQHLTLARIHRQRALLACGLAASILPHSLLLSGGGLPQHRAAYGPQSRLQFLQVQALAKASRMRAKALLLAPWQLLCSLPCLWRLPLTSPPLQPCSSRCMQTRSCQRCSACCRAHSSMLLQLELQWTWLRPSPSRCQCGDAQAMQLGQPTSSPCCSRCCTVLAEQLLNLQATAAGKLLMPAAYQHRCVHTVMVAMDGPLLGLQAHLRLVAAAATSCGASHQSSRSPAMQSPAARVRGQLRPSAAVASLVGPRCLVVGLRQ